SQTSKTLIAMNAASMIRGARAKIGWAPRSVSMPGGLGNHDESSIEQRGRDLRGGVQAWHALRHLTSYRSLSFIFSRKGIAMCRRVAQSKDVKDRAHNDVMRYTPTFAISP